MVIRDLYQPLRHLIPTFLTLEFLNREVGLLSDLAPVVSLLVMSTVTMPLSKLSSVTVFRNG